MFLPTCMVAFHGVKHWNRLVLPKFILTSFLQCLHVWSKVYLFSSFFWSCRRGNREQIESEIDRIKLNTNPITVEEVRKGNEKNTNIFKYISLFKKKSPKINSGIHTVITVLLSISFTWTEYCQLSTVYRGNINTGRPFIYGWIIKIADNNLRRNLFLHQNTKY